MSKVKAGDGHDARLLLFLKRRLQLPQARLVKIKQGIWRLETRSERWIVKKFRSEQKFRSQFFLLKKLKEASFVRTYSFHSVHESGPLEFEGGHYGLLSYIEPRPDRPIHYKEEKDRRQVLELLDSFHSVTAGFAEEAADCIPAYDQLAKWDERLEQFLEAIRPVRDDAIYPYLSAYARIGRQVLSELGGMGDYFTADPPVIIHGDLASHNVLRGQDGVLYLIDFDLIAKAPAAIDHLQFSNRILPYLGWKKERLFGCRELGRYEHDQPFLAALLYPSDIFREWNHFCKSSRMRQRAAWPYVNDLVRVQFNERIRFFQAVNDSAGKLISV